MSEDILRAEHESLQRAVQSSRKAFTSTKLSAFAQQGFDCIDQYLVMRKEGVSREDAVKGIEAVLRAIWPKATTKFYVCEACGGTGWRLMSCWDGQRCGRELCIRRHPAWEHSYVVPCDCTAGDRFRPRAAAPEDELAAVGKTPKRKPRSFSRFGG